MNKYRKRPIEIEARQFICTSYGDQKALADWCGGLLRGTKLHPQDREIEIPTFEGDMRAAFGDWIIKGVKGEFYPCKPDIFELTYEAVHG